MQCLINSCEIQCSPVSWYLSYRDFAGDTQHYYQVSTHYLARKTIYTDSFLQNHDENDVLSDGRPNMKQTRRNTSSYRGWVPLAKMSGNWVVDMKSTHTASWDMSKIPFNNAVNIKCYHRVRHPFTGHLNQMENRPPGTANTASNASNRESV